MGSKKKWTSALGGGLGLLTGDIVTAGIGAAVGHSMDKKKSAGGGGGVDAATQSAEDREKTEKAAGEGGVSPFDDGALGVSVKKKKLNTLVGGYTSGALSGSGEGSTMLG